MDKQVHSGASLLEHDKSGHDFFNNDFTPKDLILTL